MYASDEADVAVSMLIAIAVLLSGMAIFAIPIYLMIRPTVIENSAAPNLSRVVKQPLLASVDHLSSPAREVTTPITNRREMPEIKKRKDAHGVRLEVHRENLPNRARSSAKRSSAWRRTAYPSFALFDHKMRDNF